MEGLPDHHFNSRVYRIFLSLLFIFSFFPLSVSAAGSSSGGSWKAAEMPSWAVTVAIIILVAVYALIVFEWVHRALAAALGGIAAVAALHVATFYSPEQKTLLDGEQLLGPDLMTIMTWIDWETIGLLVGMMIMVDILSKTGLFEWAAVQAYARSGGSIWRLTFILCIITGVFSALLDNVTTILLIVPVTIQICKVLDLEPVPLIIAEVMFSNIGGAATQIGDPPNIIIGAQLSSQSLSGTVLEAESIGFIDFIVHVAPAVLIAMMPAFWLLRIIEKPGLSGYRRRNVDLLKIQYGIKDALLLKKSGAILVVVILLFFAHSQITHPLSSVAVIALVGAVVMLLVTSPHHVEEQFESVEWTTIIFFAGLFIMIHGLEFMGLIEMIADLISDTVSKASPDNRLMVAVLLLLWVSAIASAFIDNIPYTATMVPVVIELASDPTLNLDLGPLAWALALGACLGGNGTIIGASANVVAAGLAEESGNDISFNRFFRTGFPIMILTLILSTVYSVVRYAIEWSNPAIPFVIITLLIIGSLALTPLVYKDLDNLENVDIKNLDIESE
ncbi:MAG: ArsB/NhaD family transporter [Candidatus Thalassarchaeaceae archaeon]|nr:ArsB/NhaD family transporter [Candidatus Thalassarchaeaceae archaeon]